MFENVIYQNIRSYHSIEVSLHSKSLDLKIGAPAGSVSKVVDFRSSGPGFETCGRNLVLGSTDLTRPIQRAIALLIEH